MKSVLLTELAILVHFKSVRIILLVLFRVVVSLLAFCTSQRYLNSHFRHLLTKFAPIRTLGALSYCLPPHSPLLCADSLSVRGLYFAPKRAQKNRPHKEVQTSYHTFLVLSTPEVKFLYSRFKRNALQRVFPSQSVPVESQFNMPLPTAPFSLQAFRSKHKRRLSAPVQMEYNGSRRQLLP